MSELIDGAAVLNDVEEWFGRFIAVPDDRDLALATLWTVASHVAVETYTSPRLLIDSTTPASGKTTLLDHIGRLACAPLHAASLSSPAVLVRSLQSGIRTLLVDEVDRSLAPNKPGVEDLVAVLNSGYRRGATRPVLVPVKGGGWEVKEMPTFCPVALAGNSPRLPDDTRSRAIRILLMPDRTGSVEDSDWESLEEPAADLKSRIVTWTDQVREQIIGMPVDLPDGCIGRNKEKWRPLKRVAVVAGSHWPEIADELIVRGMAETDAEHDAGLHADPPGMTMLRDLHAVWPGEEPFVPTEQLVSKLIMHNPDYWGLSSAYGKALTARRLGQLVSQASKVTSTRQTNYGPRGYSRGALRPVWQRLGIDHPETSGFPGFPGSPGYSPSSKPEGAVQSGSPGTTSGKGSEQHKREARKPDTPDEPSEPDQMAIPSEAGSEPIQMGTCKVCGRPCKPTIAAHVECLMRRAS